MNSLVENAKFIADIKHSHQSYGEYSYTYHLNMVYEIAKEHGCPNDILVACYLHDILEDSNVTYSFLKKEFSEEIAEIVYSVTDELGRNRKERKAKTYQKLRNNWKGIVVKLCDRIANVQESIKNNPKKLLMYQKEHEEFVNALYVPTKNRLMVDSLWDRLNKLIHN